MKPTSATPLNARRQLPLLTAQVSNALASSIQAITMPLLTYGTTSGLAHSAIVMVVEAILRYPFRTLRRHHHRQIQLQKLSPQLQARQLSRRLILHHSALVVGFAGTLSLLAALTITTICDYDLTHTERTATVQEHRTGRLLREDPAYAAHNPVVRGMLRFLSITTLPMLEYLTRDYTTFGIAASVYAAGYVISSWFSAKLGVGTGRVGTYNQTRVNMHLRTRLRCRLPEHGTAPGTMGDTCALVHLGLILRTRRSARPSPLRRRYR